MSLDHAILGFLNYSPLSGYDLKKVFDSSVRHFWPADQSQIYRTLSRQVDQGWLEMEVVEQSDYPTRKVYHITDSGHEELVHWLTGPAPDKASRSAALVQVFFMGQAEDELILEKFEAYAHMMQAALAHFEELTNGLVSNLPETNTREHFFWLQTVDLGIRTTRANLEWAENIAQLLKTNQVPQAS